MKKIIVSTTLFLIAYSALANAGELDLIDSNPAEYCWALTKATPNSEHADWFADMPGFDEIMVDQLLAFLKDDMSTGALTEEDVLSSAQQCVTTKIEIQEMD